MQCDRRRIVWRLILGVALLATAAWAHPAKITFGPAQTTCGPAKHGCGPAIVLGSGATGGTAPSWVPSTLAAWMLDEASGARVNAQGTTTRNLTELFGTLGNDTTNKMEGAAAVLLAGTVNLRSTDAALIGLAEPYTCGWWVRRGTVASMRVLEDSNGGLNNGVIVDWGSDNRWTWNPSPTFYFGGSIGANTWDHVVVQQSAGVSYGFENGVLAGSTTRAFTTPGNTDFAVVGNGSFNGQLDELWCMAAAINATSICRICSCGIRGEQCTCSGTAFTSKGRNATACGSCTLPANCSAAAPS